MSRVPARRRRVLIPSILAAGAVALLLAPPAEGAPPPSGGYPSGAAVMERCVAAWYYPGRDMVARLRMEILDRGGKTSYREMTMFRKNMAGDGGEQRYLIYFHEPGDVRRMTCMVWKHIGGDDERWMYVPAIDRIRRVAAPERSRFLGSDFVREEFSGRDADADSHRVVELVRHRGRMCWKVESTPRTTTDFAHMTTWVDTTTYLPWTQEFRNRRDDVFRTFTVDRVKEIRAPDGRKIPTIVDRSVWGRDRKNRTRLIHKRVRYDVGLTDDDFTQQHLSMALEGWYRGPRP